MAIKFVLNETSYFGEKARDVLPEEIKKRNFKKVFLVSDKSLVEAGVTAKVENILKEANIEYSLYDEIKPNPSIQNVTDGVSACKNSGADVIVAVGGGSSIDTAKGISIVMTNPDRSDIRSLNGASNTVNRGMPIIALPTTAGTAAEVTINYVITDEERKIKMVCVDPNDIPIVAIVDSELMASMPKSLAAATGMDALTHALEGYITLAHNEISDMFHLKAIKMIFANLESAVNDKDQKAINARPNDAEVKQRLQSLMTTVSPDAIHYMNYQRGKYNEELLLKTFSGMIRYTCNSLNGDFNLCRAASALGVTGDVIETLLEMFEDTGMIKITDRKTESFKINFLEAVELSKALHTTKYSEFVELMNTIGDYKHKFMTMDLG